MFELVCFVVTLACLLFAAYVGVDYYLWKKNR